MDRGLDTLQRSHHPRNMTHLLAFDGRSRERENLACPYCSFDLYAMKTYSVNDEISSVLGVNIGNCRQLWRRIPLFFRNLEKLVSPTQAHRRL